MVTLFFVARVVYRKTRTLENKTKENV